MGYKAKRYLGYEPWGVTNPWVFANLAQPQRMRGYPSKYVWQTHPPREGIHPLGQIFSESYRAHRMEIYSLIGLTLTGLIVWRSMSRPVIRNRRRRKRSRS